jgi:hypothetical protein
MENPEKPGCPEASIAPKTCIPETDPRSVQTAWASLGPKNHNHVDVFVSLLCTKSYEYPSPVDGSRYSVKRSDRFREACPGKVPSSPSGCPCELSALLDKRRELGYIKPITSRKDPDNRISCHVWPPGRAYRMPSATGRR